MPNPKHILIASDHAGVDLKEALQRLLPELQWEDLGPEDADRVDYPDYAAKLAARVSSGHVMHGVLICGSGIGMCIAANKFPNVRAAVVENPIAARLSREHNDANVLCLGARFVAPEYAAEIIRTWVNTAFTGDPRHSARIQKINQLEKQNR